MLFKDIIAGRYRVFSRMKDEEKARNIGVVKYIENLASMAGVNISEWDCMELFRTGDTGNKLIDDKNEINRLFFAKVEELAVNSPAPTAGQILTDEMKQAIRAAEARHVTTLLANEQRNADQQLRYAMDKYREHENFLKKAGEHFAAMHRLSSQSSNLEGQISQVLESPFWQFIGVVGGNKITFVTRSDIIIRYTNAAAGIDISLNFGRYKVEFNVADFSLKVFGYERNINSAGYIHPHISGSSGGICWGTAANTATRLLASCQFAEPMTLLATILSNYNAASPYHSIERFQEAVGTTEEHEARDAQIERHAQIRATMAPLDQMELNVDLRQEPVVPPPEAATLANPETPAPAEAVADEEIPFDSAEAAPAVAARARPRRANSVPTTGTTSFTVTTTTTNTSF